MCGLQNDVNGRWRTLIPVPYLKVHASRIGETMEPGFSSRTQNEKGMREG